MCRTSDASSAPSARSARPKALRCRAVAAHSRLGCSHAPRPGSRAVVSTTTRPSRATTLTSEERGARCRQPRQVLTGSMLLAFSAELGVDRSWAPTLCSGSTPELGDRLPAHGCEEVDEVAVRVAHEEGAVAPRHGRGREDDVRARAEQVTNGVGIVDEEFDDDRA